MSDFSQKLYDRTKARNESLQQKMQEYSFHPRKRRPLEDQENILEQPMLPLQTKKLECTMNQKTEARDESPNKRCRMDSFKSKNGSKIVAIERPTGKKSVGERMKKLLNQRRQWDAADEEEEIDFSCISSPVHNDIQSSPVEAVLNRKIDVDRKARLAVLAEKVSSWEDDLTHAKVPSPKKATVQWKPPSGAGRKTPMIQSCQADILCNEDISENKPTSNKNIRPSKNVSQRVSLSIETLAQFTSKDKVSSAKPSANKPQKLPGKIDVPQKFENSTTSNCRVEDEPSSMVASRIKTPNSKSLKQRMVELQKHGCQAETTTEVNKAVAERQNKLNELRQEHNTVPLKQSTDIASKENTEVACMVLNESETSIDECTDLDISGVNQEGFESDTNEPSNMDDSTLSNENCLVEHTLEDTVEDDERKQITQSPMEEMPVNDEHVESSADESVSEENKMIDELFDGVDFEDDDDSILDPPLYSDTSFRNAPSLTRQKSRQEIRSELSVRKQTCNEAEDTHFIQRNPSRRLRPLARSNSMESVVSLDIEKAQTADAEKDFPVFTIDSYRNEKRKSIRKSRKVVREASVKPNQPNSQIKSMQELNAQLLAEVQQQQRVIQQASAALNCCYDTQHGKGSITELEAEKLLLIASEKRLALLAEIQKLKIPKPHRESHGGFQPCPGSLTIERIQLPLRTEYIFSMASKKDGGEQSCYYFVLIRCGGRQMFATQLASIHDSLSADCLVFKDKFEMNSLESDFEICIEVYSVNHKAKADGVPNQQEKSKSRLSEILQKSLTPRKKSRSSYQSLLSRTASPGGPNAIRISSFTLIGSVNIGLADVERKKFALQKVPFLSPITGHLACRFATKFESNAQQRGFLTMFDDVGGLGAWHRRWCVLRHGVVYAWTYPDDEKHKEALSKLELRQCISRNILMVERMMCARPNTFELKTMRPRKQGDRDNLISQDTGSVIQTKHWLAADTREERTSWIRQLNQALADVRAWDVSALQPLR